MSYPIGDFPVYAHGKNVGCVNVSHSGLMTVFDCECSHNSREILRLAAVCGGKYVTLGVMAPDNGMLRLKKSYSKNALASLGYDDAETFHLIQQGDIYTYEEEAGISPVPDNAVQEITGPEPERTEYEPQPIVYDDWPEPIYEFDEPETTATPVENQTMSMPAESEPMVIPSENEPIVIPAESELEIVYSVPEPDTLDQITETVSENYPVTETPSGSPPDGAPAGEEPSLSQDVSELQVPSAYELEINTERPEIANGWRHVSNPGALFIENSVASACEGVADALWTAREGYELLAVPVSPEEPFPLMAVFCFGSSAEIDEREYIIFKIRDGNLTL